MLENFPWLSDKTKMIRNYLDLDVFCPSLRPLPDNNRVIVVGRVVEQKNPIRFIEAIAKVASKGFSFTVDWYGNPHPMSFLADCNHKLKELGIERMFHFIHLHPILWRNITMLQYLFCRLFMKASRMCYVRLWDADCLSWQAMYAIMETF